MKRLYKLMIYGTSLMGLTLSCCPEAEKPNPKTDHDIVTEQPVTKQIHTYTGNAFKILRTDIDQDGIYDKIIASSRIHGNHDLLTLSILKGDSLETLCDFSKLYIGDNNLSIKSNDIDDDSYPDLFVVGVKKGDNARGMAYFLKNNNGKLAKPKFLGELNLFAGNSIDLYFSDENKDSRKDIVIGGCKLHDNFVAILYTYLNNGDGTFSLWKK